MRDAGHKYGESVEGNGFALIPNLVDKAHITNLVESVDHLIAEAPSAGVRDLVSKSSVVREFSKSPAIKSLVAPLLGADVQLVRSILFVKTAEMNWGVSWHQDLSIAVRQRTDMPGYSRWSDKEGITHVQPPQSVLERMLTLRLHLDPADESNGALMVAPGSHLKGRIAADKAASVAREMGTHICNAEAGDALLMKPLILHSSCKAISAKPRRIIHFEFSGAKLPEPLEWNEAA